MKRYIAFNIGVWLTLAVAAALIVAGMHRVAQGVSTRHQARAILDDAYAEYEDGDYTDAQNLIASALRIAPELEGESIERFGMGLLAMPHAHRRLWDHFGLAENGAPPLLSGEAALRAQLVLGRADGTTAEGAARQSAADSSLWLGRQALRAGEVGQARQHFDAYWSGAGASRASAAAPILAMLPDEGSIDTGLPEVLDRLLRAGLWNEAFDLAERAEKKGATAPECHAVRGLALELKGDSDGAYAAYQETLKARPTHLLAMQRAHALYERVR